MTGEGKNVGKCFRLNMYTMILTGEKWTFVSEHSAWTYFAIKLIRKLTILVAFEGNKNYAK